MAVLGLRILPVISLLFLSSISNATLDSYKLCAKAGYQIAFDRGLLVGALVCQTGLPVPEFVRNQEDVETLANRFECESRREFVLFADSYKDGFRAGLESGGRSCNK